ncbi:MAG: Fe-S cluster assembly protein IscX [Anaerolineae bacterium]|nr:Fe-S cluster assembly protein IscX [Anaerolineae bacterium]
MALYWDNSYEIVLELMEKFPDVDVEGVGIEQLYQWIIALPDFADDPHLRISVARRVTRHICDNQFEQNL